MNSTRNHSTDRMAMPRRMRGLTLVEIMIALLIGLVLTGGAIQIFVSSKQGYRANEALARIQENGRYALNFLQRDVRGTGFWGCAQDVEVNDTTDGGGAGINLGGEPIQGTDGGAGAPDTVTIRKATQGTSINVTQAMPNTSANVFLSSTDDLQEGDLMIVTDCESADLFMVTNNNVNNDNLAHNTGRSHNGVQNATTEFSNTYNTDAIAYSASETTYQITNNGLERTVNGAVERLVDDIVDLQISYGVDTDNNEVPNSYVTAAQIAANAGLDWSEILSVRIRLLARSREDNVTDAPQTQVWDFDGDGTLDDAPDRRMYQQFTTTVGLRNRLP